MALREELRRRVVEPAVVRVLQWRGDPLARLLGAGARADPGLFAPRGTMGGAGGQRRRTAPPLSAPKEMTDG
jgi:hypothetical protein